MKRANITLDKYIAELSGELSSFYNAQVDGRSCVAKIRCVISSHRGSSLSSIIVNQICVLEKLQEMGRLKECGIDYLGWGMYKGVPVVLLDIPEHQKYNSLEDRLQTNIDALAWDNENLRSKNISEEEQKKLLKTAADIVGRPLDSILEAVDIYAKSLRKLQVLHDCNIIHVDVSPENTITDSEGNVILIDHALAREKGESVLELYNPMVIGLSGAKYYGTINDILCNWFYHPPEFDSKPLPDDYKANPTIDLYNATNILCLMLTGRLMEYYKRATNKEEVEMRKLLKNDIKNLKKETLSPEQLEGLIDIIIKGTDDDWQRRPQSAEMALTTVRKLQIPPWEKEPYLPLTEPPDLSSILVERYQQYQNEAEQSLERFKMMARETVPLLRTNPLQEYYSIIDRELHSPWARLVRNVRQRFKHGQIRDDDTISGHRSSLRFAAFLAAGLLAGGLAAHWYQLHQASQSEYQPQIIIENRVVGSGVAESEKGK